jgi:hypothetical protein
MASGRWIIDFLVKNFEARLFEKPQAVTGIVATVKVRQQHLFSGIAAVFSDVNITFKVFDGLT